MKAVQEEELLLIFRVGRVMCCVSARDVDSVVNAQDLHIVPNQAETIAGMMQYRGETVSIINVFKKFHFEMPELQTQGRFIMAYTHHGVVGYWVDEVIDITSDYGAHWSDPPIFSDGNIFDKTLIWNDYLVLRTDFDKLFAMAESEPLQAWIQQHNLEDSTAELTEVYSEPETEAANSDKEQTDQMEQQTSESSFVSEPTTTIITESDVTDDSTHSVEKSLLTESTPEEESLVDTAETNSSGAELSNATTPIPVNSLPTEVAAGEQAPDEQSSESAESTIPDEFIANSEHSEITLGALDTLTDTTAFVDTELQNSNIDDSHEKSLHHVQSEFVLDVNEVRDPRQESQTALESSTRVLSQPSRGQASQSNQEDTSHTTTQSTTTSQAEKPTEKLSTSKPSQAYNSNLQTVYDNVKDYLQPPVKAKKTASKGNLNQQQPYVEPFDIEKFFAEKVGPKVQLYFESVEAAEKALCVDEIDSSVVLSENAPHEEPIDLGSGNLSHSEAWDLSSLSDKEDDIKFIDQANESQFSDFQFSQAIEAESTQQDLQKKREKSIRKVISRIESNKPQSPSIDKLRLIASVLVFASLAFILEHFELLPFNRSTGTAVADIALLSEVGRPTSVGLYDTDPSQPGAAVEKPLPSMKAHEGVTNSSALGDVVMQNNFLDMTPVPLWKKHIVVKGDTLWHIADFYLDDPFRYPDLARWSQIQNPDLIYPGDEVKYSKQGKTKALSKNEN